MTDSAEGPTPETDLAAVWIKEYTRIGNRDVYMGRSSELVSAEFARDLERRLVEAQEIGMTLQRNLGTVESEIEQLIDERDSAEETVSQIYFLVIGESPEWSNEFGHEQATEEIVEATTLLRDSVKAERARADAAVEMVEGFQRKIAAQQERYNEEVAIVNRIWAIFGTPSYEELQGKTIYDLVQAAQDESQKYRAAEQRAAAWEEKFQAECRKSDEYMNADFQCRGRAAAMARALEKIADESNYGNDGCWNAESYPDEIARAALAARRQE